MTTEPSEAAARPDRGTTDEETDRASAGSNAICESCVRQRLRSGCFWGMGLFRHRTAHTSRWPNGHHEHGFVAALPGAFTLGTRCPFAMPLRSDGHPVD